MPQKTSKAPQVSCEFRYYSLTCFSHHWISLLCPRCCLKWKSTWRTKLLRQLTCIPFPRLLSIAHGYKALLLHTVKTLSKKFKPLRSNAVCLAQFSVLLCKNSLRSGENPSHLLQASYATNTLTHIFSPPLSYSLHISATEWNFRNIYVRRSVDMRR